ncbi:MAG: saccharopine dehydrogenase [Desulfobacterales bacterium]|nr:saccharopine dehydrogenase [Desulfobacterales bacterium]
MRNILVLGAGLVAGPLVRHLLDQPEMHVTAADLMVEKAAALIGDHPNGEARELDVGDEEALQKAISAGDIVISLLPWTLHLKVARLCIEFKKHLVTASYVKPEMEALHGEAKRRGLLFLNEMGVDPGIDHMAAMAVIEKVQGGGGEIVSFHSYCGGLPALAHNNNPLGYKFSWSPEGVMLAASNPGRHLRDGEVIEVPGEALFEHYRLVDVPGAGVFEAYVNRDALPYMALYNIPSALDMYRGTLRNIGHCETWSYFKKIGLLNREKRYDLGALSPRAVVADLIRGDERRIEEETAAILGVPIFSSTIKKMAWLGLFGDEPAPLGRGSAFDMFAHILQDKLAYQEGERDLLVQHHEFRAVYPDHEEKITSTMVEEGEQDGDGAMARTVSLPAAIGARLIADGEIQLTGVQIPVRPEVYRPVLSELEAMNIRLVERVERRSLL